MIHSRAPCEQFNQQPRPVSHSELGDCERAPNASPSALGWPPTRNRSARSNCRCAGQVDDKRRLRQHARQRPGLDAFHPIDGDKTRMDLQEHDRIACRRIGPRQERYPSLSVGNWLGQGAVSGSADVASGRLYREAFDEPVQILIGQAVTATIQTHSFNE